MSVAPTLGTDDPALVVAFSIALTPAVTLASATAHPVVCHRR